ncbi:Deoxyguanosinetriphosphate triphosphohydrolase-like protein [ANME-1 cluster archaeon GoMg2]|nr:Deoxyguanosinetriphosphate triphosphohydrolase-like protein [ANME-1 cluster archaeon GoMg2]
MKQNELSDEVYKKRFKQKGEDIRGPFFRDQTAIIHSLPFRRLKRKTQVFFAPDNDHICTRIEHAFHVFTNSTTISKGLINAGWKIDIEMVQAIALGHDIGHAPFGHAGEEVLNEIVEKETNNRNSFHHEINSLRVVDYIAERGDGLKLTFGVRDGIVSHCGEELENKQFIEPVWEVKKLEEIDKLDKHPASYEGCIVRVADKISSLGRDVEDAIELKIVNADEIPDDALNYLGITPSEAGGQYNRALLNNIIYDIIDTTDSTENVGVSDEGFEFIKKINGFSKSNIYEAEKIKNYTYYVEVIIRNLYESLSDLIDKHDFNIDSYNNSFIRSYREFGNYLSAYKEFYMNLGTEKPQILVDFISGMSDNYAIRFSKDISIPKNVFK